MATQHSELCGSCTFVIRSGVSGSRQGIRVTSFSGTGRTGNSVYAVFKAFVLAYYCGMYIELPDKDHVHYAFEIRREFRVFAFPQNGARSALCYPQKGNAGLFWDLKLPFFPISQALEDELLSCFRTYLGICKRSYCKDHKLLLDKVLVAHVRNGDAFRQNYSRDVHRSYWQPPLSYYLAAVTFSSPRLTVMVGEDTLDLSPVWIMMKRLQAAKVLSTRLQFQNASIKEDIRVMLCARNLVESRSSLSIITRLGFAQQVFSYRCFAPLSTGAAVYISNFSHPAEHTNQPDEWVHLLTDPAQSFQRCEPNHHGGKIQSLLSVLCYINKEHCMQVGQTAHSSDHHTQE